MLISDLMLKIGINSTQAADRLDVPISVIAGWAFNNTQLTYEDLEDEQRIDRAMSILRQDKRIPEGVATLHLTLLREKKLTIEELELTAMVIPARLDAKDKRLSKDAEYRGLKKLEDQLKKLNKKLDEEDK